MLKDQLLSKMLRSAVGLPLDLSVYASILPLILASFCCLAVTPTSHPNCFVSNISFLYLQTLTFHTITPLYLFETLILSFWILISSNIFGSLLCFSLLYLLQSTTSLHKSIQISSESVPDYKQQQQEENCWHTAKSKEAKLLPRQWAQEEWKQTCFQRPKQQDSSCDHH